MSKPPAIMHRLNITQITSINKEVSLAVLEEFHLYTRSKSFISSGGYDFAREILKEILPYLNIYQDEEYDQEKVVDLDIMGNPVQ